MTELSSQKKKCSVCGLEKYLDHFFKEKNGLYGTRGRCKKCDKVARAAYVEENRERTRLRDRQKYADLTPDEKKIWIQKKSESNRRRLQYKPETRKKYNQSDRGIYGRYRNDANRRYRRYDFDIPFDEFKKLINAPCYYCGTPNCRGVDRKNNTLGYTVANCVSSCKICNEMKMSRSYKIWVTHMKKILKHRGEL